MPFDFWQIGMHMLSHSNKLVALARSHSIKLEAGSPIQGEGVPAFVKNRANPLVLAISHSLSHATTDTARRGKVSPVQVLLLPQIFFLIVISKLGEFYRYSLSIFDGGVDASKLGMESTEKHQPKDR